MMDITPIIFACTLLLFVIAINYFWDDYKAKRKVQEHLEQRLQRLEQLHDKTI
jgi:hypothetical protein